MPTPNPHALEFLLSRRSRPAKTLTGPWPDKDDLIPILTAAARTPDHGKLEPWRFVVLSAGALQRLATAVEDQGKLRGIEPEKIEKMRNQFANSGLAVAVIDSPVASEKVPAIEQTYSAGAVCLALLNGALAAGWGANWLSGWASHDADFLQKNLGLAPHEKLAGFIHIGTETNPPPERPRPDLNKIVSWVEH